MMDENRRSFLRKAGCTALGLGCGLPLLSTGCSDSRQGSAGQGSSQWAMIIDVQKCLDKKVREASAKACHLQHNVPEISDPKREIKWIWEENYEDAFPDQVHAQAKAALKASPVPVLVLCNHCTEPSCVRVCPTGATWKRQSDGVVMMDMHRCIGCRYCMAACPYGARSFNWSDPHAHVAQDGQGEYLSDYPIRARGVVEKCTFCAERIRLEGPDTKPACVLAANEVVEGAMRFGKLDSAEIRQILRNQRTICRRVGLGTEPNVFYIV